MKSITCDVCGTRIKDPEKFVECPDHRQIEFWGHYQKENVMVIVSTENDLCETCILKIVKGEIVLEIPPKEEERPMNLEPMDLTYMKPISELTREQLIDRIVKKIDAIKKEERKLRDDLASLG